ncbi:biotin--[acetyl-CoA-carboxylase] ligase [Thermosipho ferrireducens]|uniref:Biotin--[acetyl-CoA-carboxylase] ligase n=1 Tax=Thermosipho ferrireducens TaxID=2571116 RepID=A0ABX7S587_9BACT|nr:biotin--[acetyl-CoA-carboxylase] ligase [Thermosipho ferrireducens]QTA37672.1 biotin--[acetyl-CoA-carboxylase] ligase [Thermosipho ferrireducens]
MLGEKILIFNKIDSTNEYLKENYKKLPNGTVVVATTQTNGKGRYGKNWASPEGGLWFSILLKPRKPQPGDFYTKISSLALINILKKYGINARIKWPNDIYVNKKKLCGILTEAVYKGELEAVIIGIGLNVNNEIPEHLKNTAISIKQLIERRINPLRFLNNFLKKLRTLHAKYKNTPTLLTENWKKYLLFKEGDRIIINNREILILKIEKDYMIVQDCLTIKSIRSIHELEGTV